MKIIVVDNYDEMSKKGADIIASQVILKSNSILGLATGDTPLGIYERLIDMHKKGDVDFSEVRTFNLDEYYKLKEEDPQSYHYFMDNNLFNHINIKRENINIPNGNAEDIEKECANYDNKIYEFGGIDVQILGIGVNGHIGFNEPDSKFEAKTHLVKLKEKTIESNSRLFNSIDEVPTKAVSMGMKTIMQSKKIVLLASGKVKAEAILKAVKGDISPEVPASILQLHNDVTVIIDKEAASLL
ncbi:glucosamine-6-phosphate deaminase [Clostridium niameyense]|uniref:Glucosamine-6-phosphate deaminase n=1 Tax=Clostridium niameyense TaxID=1622073 RepID=A0A6M0RDX1_9CLOT|nr:glucosamine-6-phosphate deaminase [Clostridium niameyense]NEZ48030.1 glucosamine-6-phosphate deaminase [Clostridium niameyense]